MHNKRKQALFDMRSMTPACSQTAPAQVVTLSSALSLYSLTARSHWIVIFFLVISFRLYGQAR